MTNTADIQAKKGGLSPCVQLFFFIWLLAAQLASLGVFGSGFFLTRVELPNRSACDLDSLLTEEEKQLLNIKSIDVDGAANGCWLPRRYKRAIWVVIDALRFDFAQWSPTEARQQGSQSRHYLNKLPVIRDVLQNSGKQGHGGSLLFQFEADPPTVTMQRLKGLTTGALPTFIDFRNNFHSPEIVEDNWVDQLVKEGKRLTFMGDDTWSNLYPRQFQRAFPFPSFNTRDLHTVDDGILSQLPDELSRDDWDVLVLHFLGVDHVGHTFGPSSLAMEEKLKQMDKALRTVFSSAGDDTVVMVMGDHGMTADGNHGGATVEETGAALLMYSSGGLLLGSADSHGNGVMGWARDDGKFYKVDQVDFWSRTIAQVDLVPTLSLLLGGPIPFGSLGGVLPEVFAGPYASEESLGSGHIDQLAHYD